MMHEALVDGVVVTKRDIYYKDTQMFGSQSVVDRVSLSLLSYSPPTQALTCVVLRRSCQIVEGIASSAGLKRADFNARASPKGLWASKLVEVVLVDAFASAPQSQESADEVLRCGDLQVSTAASVASAYILSLSATT